MIFGKGEFETLVNSGEINKDSGDTYWFTARLFTRSLTSRKFTFSA